MRDLESFHDLLVHTLTHAVPLLTQGQATHLISLHSGETPRDPHQWRRKCGRVVREALADELRCAQVHSFLVANYFVQELVHERPAFTWGPGEPDPDYSRLLRGIHAYADQIVRSEHRPREPLKTFFIPRSVSRKELSLPLFSEALKVAEAVEGGRAGRGGEHVAALRVASLYLSIRRAYSEAIGTWQVTGENIHRTDSPIVPEASIRLAGKRVALRASGHWTEAQLEQLHLRMKFEGLAYQIW